MKLTTRQSLILSCALFAASLSVSQAEAQPPGWTTIRAPNTDASIKHDETNGDQVFRPQRWWVVSGRRRGATVTFATDQAFTHVQDASYKRDAHLDLRIGSSSRSARWRVTVASDQTNHATSDENAIVQAECDRAGWARLDLTVTFVTDDQDSLAQGDYILNVTGTVTAN